MEDAEYQTGMIGQRLEILSEEITALRGMTADSPPGRQNGKDKLRLTNRKLDRMEEELSQHWKEVLAQQNQI